MQGVLVAYSTLWHCSSQVKHLPILNVFFFSRKMFQNIAVLFKLYQVVYSIKFFSHSMCTTMASVRCQHTACNSIKYLLSADSQSEGQCNDEYVSES